MAKPNWFMEWATKTQSEYHEIDNITGPMWLAYLKGRDDSRAESERMKCCGNCVYFKHDLLTENCQKTDENYRSINVCDYWEMGR